jgi:hypothetical protein
MSTLTQRNTMQKKEKANINLSMYNRLDQDYYDYDSGRYIKQKSTPNKMIVHSSNHLLVPGAQLY